MKKTNTPDEIVINGVSFTFTTESVPAKQINVCSHYEFEMAALVHSAINGDRFEDVYAKYLDGTYTIDINDEDYEEN